MADTDPEAFGDIEPDDVFDTDEADPEAVARLLFLALRRVTDDDTRPELDDLDPEEKRAYVLALAFLLARLRREGTR